MAVYVVTYDLNLETRRPKIVDEVRRSPGYARLSESSYAIKTDETPEEVVSRFQKYVDEDDNFLVITLSKPYYGRHLTEVIEWLDEQLPWL